MQSGQITFTSQDSIVLGPGLLLAFSPSQERPDELLHTDITSLPPTRKDTAAQVPDFLATSALPLRTHAGILLQKLGFLTAKTPMVRHP